MDRRRGHGFPEMISWIRLLWRNSTLFSLIGQHPGQEVDHHVVGPLGPRRAVERGVMSQISQAPPPILHNDHNHLNSNPSHLYPIFTQSLQHYLAHTSFQSVVRSRLYEVDSHQPYALTYLLLTSSYLPPVPLLRRSSVSPISACLWSTSTLCSGIISRCVLHHVIHEFLARDFSQAYPLPLKNH